MSSEDILDLSAVDVLATGDDHVLLTVDDVEESLIIGPDQIAGMEPAAGEGRGSRLGVLPVARHQGWAAVDDLADLARLHVVHVVVDDARNNRRDRLTH